MLPIEEPLSCFLLIEFLILKANFFEYFLNLENDFTQDTLNRDSFTIFMCVDGEGVVQTKSGEATIAKGETVLVPAAANSILIKTAGAKFLEVTI